GLWRRGQLPDRAEFRHPKVAQLLGYVESSSRRLASAIFWAMVRHGEQLRDDQGRQTRMEMIGEHLLTIATVALEAASPAYVKSGEHIWELVDRVTAGAKAQVDRAIAELRGHNEDHMIASIGRQGIEGAYGWLSQGIIQRGLRDYLPPDSVSAKPKR